jgi:hypothetical protein
MSPRNFEKVSKTPLTLDQRVMDAPNLWYAFTTIVGLDRLFSYTARGITDNTAKHGEARVDKTTPDTTPPSI